MTSDPSDWREIFDSKIIHADGCPFAVGAHDGEGHVECSCYVTELNDAICAALHPRRQARAMTADPMAAAERVLAAADKATDGPWRACYWPLPEPGVHHVAQADPNIFSSRSLGPVSGPCATEGDAHFIAACREDAPTLAREVQRLTEALRQIDLEATTVAATRRKAGVPDEAFIGIASVARAALAVPATDTETA